MRSARALRCGGRRPLPPRVPLLRPALCDRPRGSLNTAPRALPRRYREFWLAQSSALEGLYASRLATVAAIRGACPAGGCCVALACDARFMTPNGSMGLNEARRVGRRCCARAPALCIALGCRLGLPLGHAARAPVPTAPPRRPPQVALGIPVPKFWAALMGRAIGHAPAERLVLGGRMVGSGEALSLGLVDALAPSNSQADVLGLAVKWVEAAVRLPPAARAATKQSGRAQFCADWRRYYTTEEPAYGWAAISAPAAVASIKAVLARLSGAKGGGGSGGAASKL